MNSCTVSSDPHCTAIVERTKKIITRPSAFRHSACHAALHSLSLSSCDFFCFASYNAHKLSNVQLVSYLEYRRVFLSEFSDRTKFRHRPELSLPLYPYETNYRKMLLKCEKKIDKSIPSITSKNEKGKINLMKND